MRRRRQADYRYLQAKYELTLNDEDEIDFNIQAMRRPMIVGRTNVQVYPMLFRSYMVGKQTYR